MKAAVLKEINAARKFFELFKTTVTVQHSDILSDALHEEYNKHLFNILLLLELCTPGARFEVVFKSLIGTDNEERAKALEILDNMVKGRCRDLLMDLLEPKKKDLPPISRREQSHILNGITNEQSEWLIAGALYAIGKNKYDACLETVKKFLDSDNNVIRETAVQAFREFENM